MNTSERKDNLVSTFGDEILSLKKDIEQNTEKQSEQQSRRNIFVNTNNTLEELAVEVTSTTPEDPLQKLNIPEEPASKTHEPPVQKTQIYPSIMDPNLITTVQVNRKPAIESVTKTLTKPISSRRSSQLAKRGITDQS